MITQADLGLDDEDPIDPFVLQLWNRYQRWRGRGTKHLVKHAVLREAAGQATRLELLDVASRHGFNPDEAGELRSDQAAIFQGYGDERSSPNDPWGAAWNYQEVRSGDDVVRSATNLKTQRENVATYLKNPLWWNVFETTVSFCLGDGLAFEAEDEAVQAELTIFAAEEGSVLDDTRRWILRLMLLGELAAPAIIDPMGRTSYTMWDPFKIDAVRMHCGDDIPPPELVFLRDSSPTTEGRFGLIANVEDPENPIHVTLSPHVFREDVRSSSVGEWRVIRRRKSGSTRADFTMAAVNRPELYDGNLLYARWDPTADSRGVPYCCASLELARRFHRLLYGEIDRVHGMRDHWYQIDVPGMSQDEADKRSKEGWSPRARKIVWTANGTKIIDHSPDIKAADTSEFFKMLRLLITLPTGVGPIFHGELEATYATAKVQEQPAFASLRHQQRQMERVIRRFIDFRLHTLVYFGKLHPRRSLAYKLKLPELSEDENARKIDNLSRLAAALDLGVRARLLWPEQAFEIYQRNLHSNDILHMEETLAILSGLSDEQRSSSVAVGGVKLTMPPQPEVQGIGGPMPAGPQPVAPASGGWMQVTQPEADLLDVVRHDPGLRSSLLRNGRPRVVA